MSKTTILELTTASVVSETEDFIPMVDVSDTTESGDGTTKKATVRKLLKDKALPSGDIVGTTDTQTLTNKTIDGDSNTVSNLAHGAEVDNPSSGVHGVTGDVVGTTDTQTLTNKTLTAPALTSPTMSGTWDGWISAGETWTYASADDPTYTFTVNADVTTKYSPGMRIKLTQGSVKYFIITAVGSYSGGNTPITVYGGTDYTLANATISNPFYSTAKSPQGYSMDIIKIPLSFITGTGITSADDGAILYYMPDTKQCLLVFSGRNGITAVAHSLVLEVPAYYRPPAKRYTSGTGGTGEWFQVCLSTNGELHLYSPTGTTAWRGELAWALI